MADSIRRGRGKLPPLRFAVVVVWSPDTVRSVGRPTAFQRACEREVPTGVVGEKRPFERSVDHEVERVGHDSATPARNAAS